MQFRKLSHEPRLQLIKKSSTKAVGILLLASAIGLTFLGLARYNAKAAENMPALSTAISLLLRDTKTEELYQFSLERVDAKSNDQIFEFEVTDQGGEIKALLRLQTAGKDTTISTYEQTVEKEKFAEFWQALRKLEVAQLTDLSPYTENFDQPVVAARKRIPASASYRFKFQDGLRDYPNSFEVYAIDNLEDTRYADLRDLTERFIKETFGETIDHQ